MTYKSICISSGHGLYVRGASGILDEVDEARLVVEKLAGELTARGVKVKTYHDDVSKSQGENLDRIVNWHNDQAPHDLDLSIHFNAYEQVEKPMGTEVLYVTQSVLAGQVSAAIAGCGFINRGGKKRTDLFFLNETEMPSILIEVCFVDSEADAELYEDGFEGICDAIVSSISGLEDVTGEPPPGEVAPPAALPRVDIEVSGEVLIFVNGEQVGTKG